MSPSVEELYSHSNHHCAAQSSRASSWKKKSPPRNCSVAFVSVKTIISKVTKQLEARIYLSPFFKEHENCEFFRNQCLLPPPESLDPLQA